VYESFYELTCRPFSKTPDPRFLFLGTRHEEALARLEYAVLEKELVVLTGDVGCGKTTVSRALMDSLSMDSHEVITLLNPRLTPAQFLRTLARRLGVEEDRFHKEDLLEAIYGRIYDLYGLGRTPVIIIDEAQLISGRGTFEEIRLLTNFQLDDANLVSVVLIGQPDLARKLKQAAQKPLRQRIGMQYHLGPLLPGEIKPYVLHRLAVAGREAPLFEDEAIDTLYRYSGGVPRLINNLASNALLEGFIREVGTIHADIVLNVARDFELLPQSVSGRSDDSWLERSGQEYSHKGGPE